MFTFAIVMAHAEMLYAREATTINILRALQVQYRLKVYHALSHTYLEFALTALESGGEAVAGKPGQLSDLLFFGHTGHKFSEFAVPFTFGTRGMAISTLLAKIFLALVASV